MNITIDSYRYGRFTGLEFGKDEIVNLTENLDYAFFASLQKIDEELGIESIQKTSAWLNIYDHAEEQIAICNPTCRNEIRRSFKIEDFSIEINTTPLEELFSFHLLCEKERSWFPVPPEELLASIIICVRYQHDLIAGMSAYFEKDFLRVGRIFSRRKSEKYQDVPQVVFSSASRRVVYELTRVAYEKRFKYLDLGGISLDDEAKSGITKFKMSFGSEKKAIYLGRFNGENQNELFEYCTDKGFDLT
jgi:hypothetical protein